MAVLPVEELRRVARHLALPGFGMEEQERLHASRVLVIGAGGLGCPLLQSLAAAGLGHIVLLDDDVVDLSNIHRQILFGASDVGRPKVEVAAARLRELQPGISVEARQERLDNTNALDYFRGVDLVIDGSDTFATKYLSADASEITGTPLLWGTVLRFSGQVALWHSGAGAETGAQPSVGLRDLFPEQPAADSVPDCATAGVLGATTAVVANLMATETIALLSGLRPVVPGTVLTYDALAATLCTFRVSADPAREPVTELADDYGAGACGVDSSGLAGSLLPEVRSGAAAALDIREPHEVLLSDLPADLHPHRLPLSSVGSIDDVSAALRGMGAEKVVVYCASGKRSAEFVRRYGDLGWELVSLPGGVKGIGENI
ncbi:ThiF family adenylyltransferase [Corynebacterium lowii]|uniref:Putative adenylyltransferase/sulfurtransferase MoeZ n=1 Tax=Corynebacterium lowii TaxID=1544413 RepID=A0A0Q0YWA9_9CORY|nr:ThiF family adenylyltransferase [Corynebacterium lowii]KQB86646.1 putative adenylyltransferase/sulfurtransferase MoeZ [Corynebacterium lowii]MDP9851331.1 molybdopterin/thiamine biosynthesis adenylyltransferase/rhodanese-related sulfurtransferase [Corynebacterium lowii]